MSKPEPIGLIMPGVMCNIRTDQAEHYFWVTLDEIRRETKGDHQEYKELIKKIEQQFASTIGRMHLHAAKAYEEGRIDRWTYETKKAELTKAFQMLVRG